MTGPNETNAGMPYAGTDRRSNHQLRAIFDRAYEVAKPLLESEGVSMSGSAHFLRIVLHDAFPDLHQQDIAILSAAVQRVFRERNKPAA